MVEQQHAPSRRLARVLHHLLFCPILLIVTAIAGLIFDSSAAIDQIQRQVEDLTGASGATVVRGILTSIGSEHRSGMATMIGIGTLIMGSTAVFGARPGHRDHSVRAS